MGHWLAYGFVWLRLPKIRKVTQHRPDCTATPYPTRLVSDKDRAPEVTVLGHIKDEWSLGESNP